MEIYLILKKFVIKKIILLEDNAEALGTKINKKLTGSFGEMSSFSFFVAHHMSTLEGGWLLLMILNITKC